VFWAPHEKGALVSWGTQEAGIPGRIFKTEGRKIQIVRKEIQSPRKRNPSFFLPRIQAFQRLAGESKLKASFFAAYGDPK
jgi:hypothetical protein